MATPASSRLNKLFANKERPLKPSETDKFDDIAIRKSTVSVPRSQFESTSSNEDDDYVLAFSKKPEMKELNPKTQEKPEANVFTFQSEDLTQQQIESVPLGKSKEHNADQTYRRDDIPYDGNGTPLIGRFCPFLLAAKFPYKYMNDSGSKVARRFFDEGKFYCRNWDLHYVHPPQSLTRNAVLLVPLRQVQELIDEISIAFRIHVKLPLFPFVLDFFDDGTPSPTFLGKSDSRDAFRDLTSEIPDVESSHGECPEGATTNSITAFNAFRRKLEAAALTSKAKKTNKTKSSQYKNQKGLQSSDEVKAQMWRIQRYFGIRTPTKSLQPPAGLTWEQEHAFLKGEQEKCGLLLKFLDCEKVAPYHLEHEPIIISIDVESYERNHDFITEVGVSTLDVLDIADIPPGPGGMNWTRQIRSRHFRINGRNHLVNRDFCVGRPDGFRFGKSEFVDLDGVSDAVNDCFEWPFSVQFKKEGPINPYEDMGAEDENVSVDPDIAQKGPKERNIVLLGHDVDTDRDYLHKLGCHLFNPTSSNSKNPAVWSSFFEVVDTIPHYKALTRDTQPRNLSGMCDDLKIDAIFPHNAGNDARYTLEALVAIVIKARLDQDERQCRHDPKSQGVAVDDFEAGRMRSIDDLVEHARQKAERRRDGSEAEPTTQPQAPYPSGPIDWSLPLRGEKVPKWQRKQQKISMEEQIRRYEEAEEANAADTRWHAGPERPPSEA